MIVSADRLYLLAEEEEWFAIHVEVECPTYLHTKNWKQMLFKSETRMISAKNIGFLWNPFLWSYKQAIRSKGILAQPQASQYMI